MLKFRVMLMALAATAVIAAAQVGVGQAVLTCTNGGNATGSKARLTGTYTFSFFGNNLTGTAPLAASGSVTLNGKGGVTGGIIRCNQGGLGISPITGGCYSINSDGTGWLAITTSIAVCNEDLGVDLQLAIVPFINGQIGGEFQFSSDGFGANSYTGVHEPFSGTAFLQTPIFP